ncbi:MAG TPA: hypothetical protein VJ385_10655 [Fibrobacteria bacterium]|nr:hypothetical protein [Fibrobacteria bacterium]
MRAALLFLAASIFGINRPHAAGDVKIKLHGQGWTDIGRIIHVTDTLVNNVNGNWQQSAGAQFTAKASIGEDWVGAFGFGGYQVNSSLGQAGDARLVRSALQNFITESRMTYFRGGQEDPWFTVTFGNFPFIYNKDTKNLGSYLLRGPVYPGFLTGGFKDFLIDSTKGNVLGLNIHQAIGNFSHDLVFANERELPPTGDWSAAYLARYKAFGALEFGGGINFYRILPNNEDLTTPSKRFYASDSSLIHDGKSHHPYDYQYIEVDTVTHDTVFYTHQGVKLMGLFSLDLKSVFGISSMGANDLKLYGEAAVLGVRNYGSVYNNIKERIPWTLGFNFPTWGLLDFLSVEVEYYGARYRNDLGKLGNFNTLGGGIFLYAPNNPAPIPSPVPVSYRNYKILEDGTVSVQGTNLDVQNMIQDDWKWSVYLERNVLEHIRFIGQVANDHYRPRPTAGLIQESGGNAEAFSSLKDWYWMFRVGYYF